MAESNNDVLVTVVMTCYNHAKYVGLALESVLKQKTDFKFKIVIHDDASTDGSAAIINKYEKLYPEMICAIYQEENQCSKGVKISPKYIFPRIEGKYVAYCECDDFWLSENKLQKQVAFLEDHPDISGTAHSCICVDADGNEIEHYYDCYPNEGERRYTLFDNALDYRYPGQTATVVHRREALNFLNAEQAADYYGMRTKVGDAKRNLQLLLWGDIYCFAEEMSAYRVVLNHGDSWSARNHGKNLYFEMYTASIDQRKYVWKYSRRIYPNYFSTFRKGAKGIFLYLKSPTAENKQVYKQLCEDKGGIVPLLAYLFGLGFLSVPYYFMRQYALYRMQKRIHAKNNTAA